ncbi:2-oxoacid:acceptor oxidoreductase family protein, partial [Candidatus Sumerlaeota bacterium]|nr:2-oxoacid:acceptor oxidoreductase family protein [Candidatus Sumerlaeota bacterium]
MSLAVTEERRDADQKSDRPLVNDVVIEVATKNGSGSTSSNLILMRSIFNMGIPVSAKNLFPSNIEGLPTWFTIRANEDGWLARRERSDFLICMNPETAADDIAQFRSGGFLILNEALKGFIKRDDLHVLAIPFDKLIKEACPDARLRKKIINVLYVGVMAYLLDIDMEEVKNATRKQFAKKAKAAELNINATAAGYQWAKENLERQTQFTLRPSEASRGKVIIEGNQATALGMVFGGATVCAWYPITPSSSCGEAFTQYCEQYRNDPETGKATYAIIQAEDELASIAMVIGAGWTGARAFTCTSGPGISLMAEAAGLAHFAEIPAVIVDVQRLGPSTGLPTRTSQGDIASAYQLSHGDCKHVLLLPGNVQESDEFAQTGLAPAARL